MEATSLNDGAQNFARWLAEARAGSHEALGRALKACEVYLSHACRRELRRSLAPKLSDSDLVQDTFLEALRDFDNFRGNTAEEFAAWLVRILNNNIRNAARFYDREKRQVAREISLHRCRRLAPSTSDSRGGSPAPDSAVSRQEVSERLQCALGTLPARYRQVVILRVYRHFTFRAIGQKFGRTASAAEKLWGRAVGRLRQQVGG